MAHDGRVAHEVEEDLEARLGRDELGAVRLVLLEHRIRDVAEHLRNLALRFKVEHEPLDDFARTQLDGGDLDHLVEADVKARGLRVEDDELALVGAHEVLERADGLLFVMRAVEHEVGGKKPAPGKFDGKVVSDLLEGEVLLRAEPIDELGPGGASEVVLEHAQVGLGGLEDVLPEDVAAGDLEVLDVLCLEGGADGVGLAVARHDDGRRLLGASPFEQVAQQHQLRLRRGRADGAQGPFGSCDRLLGLGQELGIALEHALRIGVEHVEQVVGRAEVPVEAVDLVRLVKGPECVELGAHEGEDRLLLVAEVDAHAPVDRVVPELFDDVELQGREVLYLVDLDPGVAPAGLGGGVEPGPGLEEQVVEVEQVLRGLVLEVAPCGRVDRGMVELDAAAEVVDLDQSEGVELVLVLLVDVEFWRAMKRLLGEAVRLLKEPCRARHDVVGGVARQGPSSAAAGDVLDEKALDHVVDVVLVEDRRDLGDDVVVKEKAGAEAVEVAHVKGVHAPVREALVDALLHAARGSVREREAEHVGEVHAVLERDGDALGEDGGLAAARRCEHEMAPLRELDRGLLVGVEDDGGALRGDPRLGRRERPEVGIAELAVEKRHEPDRDPVSVLEALSGVVGRAHAVVALARLEHRPGRPEPEVRGLVAQIADAAEVFEREAVGELAHERRAHHLRIGVPVVLEDRAQHALGKLAHDLRALAVVMVAKEVFGLFAESGECRLAELQRREVHVAGLLRRMRPQSKS